MTSAMCASRARRSRSSSPTRSAWAGRPNGSRPWSSDFNFDYHVSFTRGRAGKGKVYYNYELIDGSDALRRAARPQRVLQGRSRTVFHTYSSYARGNEEVIGAFIYLDMTPKGRNEKEIMDWVKRNDEYDIVTAVLLPLRRACFKPRVIEAAERKGDSDELCRRICRAGAEEEPEGLSRRWPRRPARSGRIMARWNTSNASPTT